MSSTSNGEVTSGDSHGSSVTSGNDRGIPRRRILQVAGGVMGLGTASLVGYGVATRYFGDEIEPTTEQYTRGDRSFAIDVFTPRGISNSHPALLLFHGGGWNSGDRTQMHAQCQYLASHGYVAASADYRVDATVLDCAQDALAAYEYLLANADDLRIDAARVAVGGGSAGGHIAACMLSCPVVAPSAAPPAAVLFNPALDLVSIADAGDLDVFDVGTDFVSLSPVHQDLSETPPTIIFHGTADIVVPIEGSRAYRDAAVDAGASCELEEYDGRHHEFYQPRTDPDELHDPNAFYDPGDFDTTIEATRGFLDSNL